jgi:hypothetical protein
MLNFIESFNEKTPHTLSEFPSISSDVSYLKRFPTLQWMTSTVTTTQHQHLTNYKI